MFKRILIGYDGSEAADKAFDYAVDLAAKYGAELHVLSVVRPPDFPNSATDVAQAEISMEHFEERFASLGDRAREHGAKIDCKLVVGHPAEELVKQAEADSADLVVTGHRGTGMFERWLLGSVSRMVIAHAPCPVLVVR